VQSRAAGFLFFLLLGSGGIVACTSSNSSSGLLSTLPATGGPHGASGSTPIQHVIIVIQENRSFDNFFATFPGADGTTVGQAVAMPAPIASSCAEKGQPVITQPTTVPLTEVSLQGYGFKNNFAANVDLAHEYGPGYLFDCNAATVQPSKSDPCQMNGFDLTKEGANGQGPQATCTYTYQYVNPSQIQPYWDMAQQYVLADETFQTQGSESFTAHQDLIAGGTAINTTESVIDDPTGFPWGCDAQPANPPSQMGSVTSLLTTEGKYLLDQGPFPCFTQYKTMRDLLDAKGISWKFYGDEVYVWHNPKSNGPDIWTAFDAIKDVRYGSEWGTKVVWPDTNIFNDIKDGNLPAVSWLTPNAPNSDHPAEKSDTGPSWVASVVNAIGQSQYWNSSAIVVMWDDWGGFYDHVPPPFYDDHGGLGFRIPMLIISPYVQAHVEHTQYETTSVLKFIEKNWDLGTLGQADERATSIGNAFDFNQSPRAFKVIPAKYSLQFFLRQKQSGRPPDTE